jgi:hypothetical protein
MNTYSAHRRVTGSGYLLNRGLGGYYQGNLPRVLWATGYVPNFGYNRFPLAANN